jgi:hypothetical protein
LIVGTLLNSAYTYSSVAVSIKMKNEELKIKFNDWGKGLAVGAVIPALACFATGGPMCAVAGGLALLDEESALLDLQAFLKNKYKFIQEEISLVNLSDLILENLQNSVFENGSFKSVPLVESDIREALKYENLSVDQTNQIITFLEN